MSIDIQPAAQPWEVVPDSDYLRFQIVTAREERCVHPQCSQRVVDAVFWLSIGRHQTAQDAANFVDEHCPDSPVQVSEPIPSSVEVLESAQQELDTAL